MDEDEKSNIELSTPGAVLRTQRQLAKLDLSDLTVFIREELQHAARIMGQARSNAGLHAIDAGRGLILAKDKLPHGEFEGYVKREFRLSYRTARLYMQLARKAPELRRRQSGNVASLPTVRGLLAMAKRESPKPIKQAAQEGGQAKTVGPRKARGITDLLIEVGALLNTLSAEEFEECVLPELEHIVKLARLRKERSERSRGDAEQSEDQKPREAPVYVTTAQMREVHQLRRAASTAKDGEDAEQPEDAEVVKEHDD